uniref:Photosystem I reaction center subunit III n=1 Tax=Karlodinium veneficum TaxID=407301 RepID=G1E795_KARVE|nr:photosystem I subunit III [Karlodinium veneficum]
MSFFIPNRIVEWSTGSDELSLQNSILLPCNILEGFIKKRIENFFDLIKNTRLSYSPFDLWSNVKISFSTKDFFNIEESQWNQIEESYANYIDNGILCEKMDGLPRIEITSLEEFIFPSIYFIYIAGCIGWAGRSYLNEISWGTIENRIEAEYIINIPLATRVMFNSLWWLVLFLNELIFGKLISLDMSLVLQDDLDITNDVTTSYSPLLKYFSSIPVLLIFWLIFTAGFIIELLNFFYGR